jgi:hypothetical protein
MPRHTHRMAPKWGHFTAASARTEQSRWHGPNAGCQVRPSSNVGVGRNSDDEGLPEIRAYGRASA